MARKFRDLRPLTPAQHENRERTWQYDMAAQDLAALAVREPESFPPNAQPIVARLLEFAWKPTEEATSAE